MRSRFVRAALDEFAGKYHTSDDSRTNNTVQVINFGVGFDSLYWRMKSQREMLKYIEIDQADVVWGKIENIRRFNLLGDGEGPRGNSKWPS